MLALSGLPFFSGYYSKEAILSGTLEWVTYNSIGGIGWKALVPLMAFMSVFMTAAYMGRQYFMVFFGAPRWTVHQHKESWYVAVPVLALAGLSLWFFYGFNPFHAEPFLMQLLHYKGSLGSEHLINATVLGVVSVVLALAGLGTAYCIYGMGKGQKIRQSARQHLGGLSLHHWYMDLIQQKIIVQPAQRLSAALYTIDKRYVDGVVNFIGVFHVVFSQILGWLDKYLVDGVIHAITRLSGTLGHLARSVQNGRVQSYYVWALVGIVLVLIALL
jgi:NADH-quinone oxidoreductase subunit L